jgi:hypothetical protein
MVLLCPGRKIIGQYLTLGITEFTEEYRINKKKMKISTKLKKEVSEGL